MKHSPFRLLEGLLGCSTFMLSCNTQRTYPIRINALDAALVGKHVLFLNPLFRQVFRHENLAGNFTYLGNEQNATQLLQASVPEVASRYIDVRLQFPLKRSAEAIEGVTLEDPLSD